MTLSDVRGLGEVEVEQINWLLRDVERDSGRSVRRETPTASVEGPDKEDDQDVSPHCSNNISHPQLF
jgi:hypothetical protein